MYCIELLYTMYMYLYITIPSIYSGMLQNFPDQDIFYSAFHVFFLFYFVCFVFFFFLEKTVHMQISSRQLFHKMFNRFVLSHECYTLINIF